MQTLFKQQSHTLSGGNVLSGVSEQYLTLRVLSGRVWITFEGQPEDHWLRAGRSLALLPGRLVVVEGDAGSSRISLNGLPQRGTSSLLHVVFSHLRGANFHPAASVS